MLPRRVRFEKPGRRAGAAWGDKPADPLAGLKLTAAAMEAHFEALLVAGYNADTVRGRRGRPWATPSRSGRNRCEWATSRQWLVMADTVALATGRAVQWIAAGIKAAIKAGIRVSPIAGSS